MSLSDERKYYLMQFGEKKLLICSYYLPPTKTVAALRIFNFHFEAKKYFSDIYCITTSNRNLFQKEIYAFDDSNTSEITTWDLRRFLLKKNDASPALKGANKKSPIYKFFAKLTYSFPFNLFLADGGITYILGGFFKGKKLIRENNIEYVFSSYKPYADHMICFLLKKWNPNLYWIADFRDLHVDSNRKNVLLVRFQKWCNRKILSKANIVTTVSYGLAKNLKQYHPNIYVLRNGIHQLPKDLPPTPQPFFNITYTGSIYPNMQSAQILFEAINNLFRTKKIAPNNIRIVYVGKDEIIWKNWISKNNLESVAEIKGLVSHQEAKQLQSNSHINLLLSWSSNLLTGILTGKFYEYLAARNPILLLINGTKDQEFEDIFQQTNAGLVAYNNKENCTLVESFILGQYETWLKKGVVDQPISIDSLKAFTWNGQMGKFINNVYLPLNSKEIS